MLRLINKQGINRILKYQHYGFTVDIPTVDIQKHLEGKSCQSEANEILESLNKYGVIVIRDPRMK